MAYNGTPPTNTQPMSGPAVNGNMARPDPLRTATSNSTKAEKFEDEKLRIMNSCFSKRDETGKLVASYITHVKVEEDAAYQSSPPPLDSNPAYKKPRAIILAVRSTGRVQMHKARENEDGTFQVGKTWGLEELSAVQSYSNSLPKTPEQQKMADNAGPLGFLITMSKPYYWQAKSPKEKEFFIGSLVKIYNKFTGGKLPELIGFDPKDRDAIIASTRSGRQPPPAGLQTGPQQPVPSIPSVTGPTSPGPGSDFSNGPPSSSGPGSIASSFAPPDRPYVGQERRPSSNSSNFSSNPPSLPPGEAQPTSPYRPSQPPMSGPRPYQQRPQGGASPRYPSPASSQNGPPQLRQRPSREQGLRQPSPYQAFSRSPGPGGPPRLTPQSSRPHLQDSSRTTSASSATPMASPRRPSSPSSHMRPPNNTPSFASSMTSADGAPPSLASSTNDRWRPSVTEGDKQSPEIPSTLAQTTPSSTQNGNSGDVDRSNGVPQKVPERRRPPLQDAAYGESPRAVKPEASRPKTPAEKLLPPDSGERPTTPATPQPPGAFETASTTPIKASEERTEAAVAPQPMIDREVPGNADTTSAKTESDAPPEQQYRPGLGPMMGKRAVANKFMKAANVSRAFQPRAGGAGERLKRQNDGGQSETITSVVPARSSARNSQKAEAKPATPDAQAQAKRLSPPALDIPQLREPEATPSRPNTGDRPPSRQLVETTQSDAALEDVPKPLAVQKTSKTPDPRPRSMEKPKRKPNPFVDAFLNLGIDPSFAADERALNFEDQLTTFGWERHFLQRKKFDAMQTNMRREAGRIEAGSWAGFSDEKDVRVADFEKSLDKAIEAVDEMDGLLTLYSVELSTLVDDVAYIEAQSQGLQVQTANQKLLQNELETLVSTVSIDARQLEPLRTATIGDTRDLESIERSLGLLYKALQKIDPSAIHRDNPSQFAAHNPPGQGMRALQDRKQQYMDEVNIFIDRLKLYIEPAFSSALSKARDSLQRSSVSSRSSTSAHNAGRADLWPYNPIMLFVKEVSPPTWKDVLKLYRDRARAVYQDETRDSIVEWKKRCRKINPDDQDMLFTAQEAEVENTGLASTAVRKMTIKRSGTLARSLTKASASQRERSGSVFASSPRSIDANQLPFEVFAGVLADSVPTIAAEQNFVTDFFHASSLESIDFVDAVNAERPADRKVTDLYARRMHDPDRAMSDAVRQNIESIFAAWAIETQALLEWALGQHQLQGVGILYALERMRLDLVDSNQEYLLKVLSQQYSWLISKFKPFVDSQILAIENTKIKTTKRRGVMTFVRIFPTFVSAIESMLQPADTTDPLALNPASSYAPDTRALVDEAYTSLTAAMFRTLDSIAKETPSASNTADPEDKEKLNAEILLIENTFLLSSDLSADATLLRNPVLNGCRTKADTTMHTHRSRYIAAVIRRPLGRLLDFLEGVEADQSKSGQATYGRSAFKKVLGAYDAKTVRRDIEALKRRVEKHFHGEGAEEGQVASHVGQGAQRLVGEILAECEARYGDVLDRTERVVREVYNGDLEVGFGKNDVGQAFRR